MAYLSRDWFGGRLSGDACISHDSSTTKSMADGEHVQIGAPIGCFFESSHARMFPRRYLQVASEGAPSRYNCRVGIQRREGACAPCVARALGRIRSVLTSVMVETSIRHITSMRKYRGAWISSRRFE